MIYFVIVFFFNLIFLKIIYLLGDYIICMIIQIKSEKTLNTNSSVGRFNSLPQFNFLYVVLIFLNFHIITFFQMKNWLYLFQLAHYFLF